MQRFRMTYAKKESLRYTGNLDMHRMWERSLRRAGLPVAYSQGFHPQARIQQACPLPLGFLSEVEVVDFWLNGDSYSNDYVFEALRTAVPSGLALKSIDQVADLYEKALMGRTKTATYEARLLDEDYSLSELKNRVQQILDAVVVPRIRRGKEYDLRPLIIDLHLASQSPLTLQMTLSASEGATGRPEEVLDQMGIDTLRVRVIRIGIEFIS